MAVLILWPVYAVVLAISTITILNQTQVPLLLASDHDVPPTTIAWVITAGTLAYTIGSLFYGSLQVRIGARRMFALNLALIGSGVTILGLSHMLMLSAFGCILLGTGGGLMQPYMLNILLDRAAPETRGRAIGLLSPAINLGQFLSPLLFFLLFTNLGGHGAFLAIGITLFLSATIGLRTGVPAVRARTGGGGTQPTS
ncbi:MFS transporter [Rhizorhabdus histidinilytica]